MNITNQIQFILSYNGEKKFAVLPIDVFDRLTDMYEELEAIKAYDKAKNQRVKKYLLIKCLKK